MPRKISGMTVIIGVLTGLWNGITNYDNLRNFIAGLFLSIAIILAPYSD